MTDILDMATAYQRTAVVAAACITGIANAVAGAPRTVDEVAGACGTSARGTAGLLRAMAALGLAERTSDGYVLSEAGAPLSTHHPRTLARVVAKEWFFAHAWIELPDAVVDGRARVGPWAERLRADPSAGLGFLAALDDLGAMFGAEAADLAGLDAPRTLLDAGGGSGIHAAHLLSRHPALHATVLDLPAVAPLVAELHPELHFAGGDLMTPRFGLAPGLIYDVVLMANVLHDHPPQVAARLVGAAAPLVAPGGTLLVYEWLRGDDDDPRGERADVALFDLMMMVENEGGQAYPQGVVEGWLTQAGLIGVETRAGHGPIAVVRGTRPAEAA
jgi:hypothetical protein